jgi:hemoglobin/transferrin/lactoferrin receptor protein
MAGVINIITKNVSQGTFAEANAAIGQGGYRYVNFMAGGKAGKNKNIVQYTFYGNKGSRDDMNLKTSNDNNYNALSYFYRVFNELGDSPQEIRDAINYLNQNHGEAMGIMSQVFPHYQGEIDAPIIGKYPHDSYLVGTKISYKNFQLSIDEMRRKDHSSLGLNTMFFSHANPDTYYAERIQKFTLSSQNSYKKLNFMSNLSYLRYRLDNRSSSATNYENGANGRAFIYQTSDDIFAESVMNYNINKNLEFSAGASYLISSHLPETNESINPIPTESYRPFKNDKYQVNEIIGDFGFYPNIFRNFGGFFQLFYQKKRWSLLFSRRWDMPSDYSRQAYNRAAILFKTSRKSSLRISVGYAFKTPSPYRRFSTTAYVDRDIDFPSLDKILYAQVPNPNLEPEELNNIEFGYRYIPNNSWEFDASLYLQNTDQFISALTVPLDTLQYPRFSPNSYLTRTYANDSLSRSSLFGFQMTMRAKNLSQKYKLNADLNLHFAAGQEVLPNAGLVDSNGNYVPIANGDTIDVYRQMPNIMGQLRINFMPTSRLYVNLDNTFMSSWYRRYIIDEFDFNDPNAISKGFYNLDFVMRYQITKTFSAYVKIINVFDSPYSGIDATGLDIDMVQNPQLGRNIQFGINFAKF